MALDPAYVAAFKADLAALTSEDMFRKYVMPDACRGLPGISQLDLRQTIADRFEIPVQNVIIVGSAKLGFTLTNKEAKNSGEEDRPPFSPFCDGSDVDVALVSNDIFDRYWKSTFEFWHSSGYSRADNYWPRGKNFRNYIFRGWMRPDMLPKGSSVAMQNEWFEFFRQITNSGLAAGYPVKAGVYREQYFLERYQSQSLEKAKLDGLLN